jgi:hypothetical protein
MDSPWVFAVVVFFAIYLLFFIISLLADLYIVGVALIAAIFAYNIPKLYPTIQSTFSELKLLNNIGLQLPEQATTQAYYMVIAVVVVVSVFVCIPVLPFSATYRQMLGANRLSKHEEGCVKQLVHEEITALQVEPVAKEEDDSPAEHEPKDTDENSQDSTPDAGNQHSNSARFRWPRRRTA